MSDRVRGHCDRCGTEVIWDAPEYGSASFGESPWNIAAKVPCTRCRNVGCIYDGHVE